MNLLLTRMWAQRTPQRGSLGLPWYQSDSANTAATSFSVGLDDTDTPESFTAGRSETRDVWA